VEAGIRSVSKGMKPTNFVIDEMNIVFKHNGVRYRLLIRHDDCTRLILINEDEGDFVESECVNSIGVGLDLVMRFIRAKLAD